ncbi:MAG: hypothetical protein LBV58_04910 [Acholeplasmatales bacterium]|jgi:hypothetical protein|nr:hypothetical protein [Acholeplasmatales bacterium]
MYKIIIRFFLVLVLFILILFDYRYVAFYKGKVLLNKAISISNVSELYDKASLFSKVEIYESPLLEKAAEENEWLYLAIYTDTELFTIKTKDSDMDFLNKAFFTNGITIEKVYPTNILMYIFIFICCLILPVYKKIKIEGD